MPSFYTILWIFIVYAFLGWCLEVSFEALCHGTFINRGFLNGPVCPIYGFGVLIVVLLLGPIADNLGLLFLGSVLLTSALEFLTGFVLEKIFHDKWWDYSKEPCNLKGYVCLRFSIAWGLACVFVLRIIHPLILGVIARLPQRLGFILLAAFYALLLTDAVLTVVAASRMLKRLQHMQALSARLRELSDGIGKPIAESTINLKGKLDAAREDADALRARLKALAEEHGGMEKRLLKSFPRLQQGRYRESAARLREVWERRHS